MYFLLLCGDSKKCFLFVRRGTKYYFFLSAMTEARSLLLLSTHHLDGTPKELEASESAVMISVRIILFQ